MKSFNDVLKDVEKQEESITISRGFNGTIQTHLNLIDTQSAFEMLVTIISALAEYFDEKQLIIAVKSGVYLSEHKD